MGTDPKRRFLRGGISGGEKKRRPAIRSRALVESFNLEPGFNGCGGKKSVPQELGKIEMGGESRHSSVTSLLRKKDNPHPLSTFSVKMSSLCRQRRPRKTTGGKGEAKAKD